MCIIAAKYSKNYGWILIKNRDQDYFPNVSFSDENHPTVGEIMCLSDNHTGYREGMNQKGLTIITASLTPILTAEKDKSDGDAIHHSLQLQSPEEAAKYLISQKITGFIFIATPEKLIFIEAREQFKQALHTFCSQKI